jgi:hypothetical protein
MKIEVFEPGDCTSYIMGLSEIPAGSTGAGSLGVYESGGYVLNVLNLGHVIIFTKGSYLTLGYIEPLDIACDSIMD